MADDEDVSGSYSDDSEDYSSDSDISADNMDMTSMLLLTAGFNPQALPSAHRIPGDHPMPPPMEEAQQPTTTPAERWDTFLTTFASGSGKVLKITDVNWSDYGMGAEAAEDRAALDAAIDALVEATRSRSVGITHVVLGRSCLFAMTKDQQRRLWESLAVHHHKTLTYVKLGSDDTVPGTAPARTFDTPVLLHALTKCEHPLQCTELELRDLRLEHVSDVVLLSELLLRQGQQKMQDDSSSCRQLKQLNLLSMDTRSMALAERTHVLDPLVDAVAQLEALDELKLATRRGSVLNDTPGVSSCSALLSTASLAHLMDCKKKWWRLALDGLGLTNGHCTVLERAFAQTATCKVGDLLSLEDNPAMSTEGFSKLFPVLFNKQRMGMVRVDDLNWVSTFDLVRSMNNLHRRLDYMGSMPNTQEEEDGPAPQQSREQWVEWLAKLANLQWETETHKINYLWFSLLEHPNYVLPPPSPLPSSDKESSIPHQKHGWTEEPSTSLDPTQKRPRS